jgi:hypothetical protein
MKKQKSGVATAYRKRRREISTVESVDTLDHMKEFFCDGENWRKHVYQGGDGGQCLRGAAEHVRVSQIDDAKHWLMVAIKEKTGMASIEQFNDTRNSFAEINEIIDRAKELARAGGSKAVALVGEVLPPVRVALPAPAPATALPVVQANWPPVTADDPWATPSFHPAPPRRRPTARRSFWDWAAD